MYTKMSSLNRHLLDAYFAWFHENGLYQINMVCYYEPLNCPALQPFVQDGMVVLNVSPNAVRNFRYTDTGFAFSMMIRGVPCDVAVPYYAMESITLPFDTNVRVPAPFPPLELLMKQIDANMNDPVLQALMDQEVEDHADASNEDLPDGAFAVRGVSTAPPEREHNSVHPDSSKCTKGRAQTAVGLRSLRGDKIPLLTQPKSRFTGKPTLTVIKGGRAN